MDFVHLNLKDSESLHFVSDLHPRMDGHGISPDRIFPIKNSTKSRRGLTHWSYGDFLRKKTKKVHESKRCG